MSWANATNWAKSAYNTLWCLIGCSIGDFGTILWFQHFRPVFAVENRWLVWGLAIVAGLITSMILETLILCREQGLGRAFRIAIGMSLISMIAMELAMNLTDFFLVGQPLMTWKTLAPMLLAGFLVPWPYNYWRLEKLGKSCCGS